MNTNEGLDYAWKWFEYHAGQRLEGFRFFLVFLGAILVGLTSSLKDRNILFAFLTSGAGLFISIAFLMLEMRNENLVNVGREGLRAIESSKDFQNLPSELQLLRMDQKRPFLLSHKFWFRLIYIVCMLLFLVLFVLLFLMPAMVLGPTSGKAM